MRDHLKPRPCSRPRLTAIHVSAHIMMGEKFNLRAEPGLEVLSDAPFTKLFHAGSDAQAQC